MNTKILVSAVVVSVFSMIGSSCSNYEEYPKSLVIEANRKPESKYAYTIRMGTQEHLRHSLHAMEFFGDDVHVRQEYLYVTRPFGLNTDSDILVSEVYDIPVRGFIKIDEKYVEINLELLRGEHFRDTENRKWIKYEGNGTYAYSRSN